ncbi:hypothetical protein HPB50_026757 [Hyalomma asiaticum]|uniref:Uncharacterized protein n=1 Tax=Hyalomma asiaticum TaxID=266040 RepID=A0ACB7RWJ4_HYAAI|nr:hypothetical protein HPB50_026757 [Hyalomma asiaticum]
MYVRREEKGKESWDICAKPKSVGDLHSFPGLAAKVRRLLGRQAGRQLAAPHSGARAASLESASDKQRNSACERGRKGNPDRRTEPRRQKRNENEQRV